MSNHLRIGLAGGFAAAATVLAMSSVAWACGTSAVSQSATPGAVTATPAATAGTAGTASTPAAIPQASSTAPAATPVVIPSATSANATPAANAPASATANAPAAANAVAAAAAAASSNAAANAPAGASVGAPTGIATPPPAAAATGSGADNPTPATPSPRSVEANLWSGFSTGPASHPASLNTLPPTSQSPLNLSTGLALFLAGLAAMLVGFAGAELHRRRVPHTQRTTTRERITAR